MKLSLLTHSTPSGKYDDIINLTRPIIKNHRPMSRDLRAAQFAPYATLVGHKEILQNVEAENGYQEPEILLDGTDGDSDCNISPNVLPD